MFYVARNPVTNRHDLHGRNTLHCRRRQASYDAETVIPASYAAGVGQPHDMVGFGAKPALRLHADGSRVTANCGSKPSVTVLDRGKPGGGEGPAAAMVHGCKFNPGDAQHCPHPPVMDLQAATGETAEIFDTTSHEINFSPRYIHC